MIAYYQGAHTTPSTVFWWHSVLGGALVFAIGPITAWRMRHAYSIVEVPEHDVEEIEL